MKLEHSLTPQTKVNSKWTKDLNIRLKLLEENRQNTDINHSNIFFNLSSRVMEIKTKIKKNETQLNSKASAQSRKS